MFQVSPSVTRFDLFPTLVYMIDAPDLLSEVRDVFATVKWKDVDSPGTPSKSFTILKKHEVLTRKITNKVSNALLELHYQSHPKLTTSWFFKLKPGAEHKKHYHTNSWWSASFYFEEGERECFNLVTPSPQINVRSYPDNPLLNQYGRAPFTAKCGTMILFPSYVNHYVNANNFSVDRHVLAMNFMPDGDTGFQDSHFTY